MRIYIIDCKKLETKELAFRYLIDLLHLPDYCGNNLDALADCLEEFHYDSEIHLLNSDSLETNLGQYGKAIISVFEDCCCNAIIA